MEKNKRLMSSTGSASLEGWVGTREEVKCIVLEQNMPFAFGCDSNITRFMYCTLLMNFCAPTVYVKLVSSPVIKHKRSEAWNPFFYLLLQGMFILAHASSSPSLSNRAISAFPRWGFCCLCSYNSPFQLRPCACIPPPMPSSVGAVGR